MSLARNTKLSWANTQLPMMQLPWEQLDSIMASNQQQKTIANQMTDLTPRFISQSEPDVALASQVKAYQQQIKQQLAAIAATGNTSDYMSALNNVQSQIKSLYQPGGAAYTLESRYAEFEKQKENISKATEKNVNPLYKPFFENQLLEQLKEKDIYNSTTRVGKSIQPVNIFGEVQIGEEIDKYFKDWAKTKNVSIDKWIDKSGKVNPYYFEKYSVEGVGEQELQDALKFFYNQPHIKQAMGVEAWDIKRRIDPTLESQLVSEATMAQQTKFEASKAQELSRLNVLEQKKNTKAVQDIIEQAGFKTWDEYKQSQLKDIEDKANEMATNPPTIDDIISEQIKSKYTNAYTPKYAAIKEDRDLIVNQEAMENLRHANKMAENKQMLKGMETIYRDPTMPTFKTEVGVESTTVGSLFTDYTEAKNNFDATEASLKTNPANLAMRGILTGYNNKSNTEQLLLVREAAIAATKDGKIDHIQFAQHLNSNGAKVTDFAAAKMIDFLKNPNNRAQLESFSDMAIPAYNVYTSSKENLQEQVKELDNGLKINWIKVAKDGGYKDKNGLPDVNLAKEAFNRGDTGAISLLQKQVPRDTKVNSTTTVFKNTSLSSLDKTLVNGLNASLPSLVAENIGSLSKEDLATLGFKLDGGKLVGEDKNPITDITVGTRKINGKNEFTYFVSGKYGSKPVALRPNQLSKDFNNEYLLNLVAVNLNPDNYGEVRNEVNYNDASALFFDHNYSAAGLNTSRIQAAYNRDDTQVASFKERISGDNVEVRVITDSETKQKYLIGVTGGAKSVLNKYKVGSNYDVAKFHRENPNVAESHDLIQDNSNDAVLESLTRLKASWAKPEIQYELMVNPQKIIRQKSNITGQASSILLNSNDETFNDN